MLLSDYLKTLHKSVGRLIKNLLLILMFILLLKKKENDFLTKKSIPNSYRTHGAPLIACGPRAGPTKTNGAQCIRYEFGLVFLVRITLPEKEYRIRSNVDMWILWDAVIVYMAPRKWSIFIIIRLFLFFPLIILNICVHMVWCHYYYIWYRI